jgi:hypothetical protein
MGATVNDYLVALRAEHGDITPEDLDEAYRVFGAAFDAWLDSALDKRKRHPES